MAEYETLSLDNATDAIAKLLAEPVIKKTKDILDEYDIPPYRYSFFMTGEDKVAIVFRDDTWDVVYTERGKEHTKSFESSDDACRYLLFSVSDNDEQYNAMISRFDENSEEGRRGISAHSIRDALKKAASSAAVF